MMELSSKPGIPPETGYLWLRARLDWLKSSRPVIALYQSQLYSFLLYAVATAVWILLTQRGTLLIGPFQKSDLNVPFYGMNQMYYSLFPAWNFQNFGSPSGYSQWLVITGYVASLSGSTALVEKGLYISVPLFGALTSYWMLGLLGVNRIHKAILGWIFVLSPWFIGQYLTGEPVFTWIFAIFPLYASAIVLATNLKFHLLPAAAVAAVALLVATWFSAQALVLYPLLAIPLAVPTLSIGSWSARLRLLLTVFISISVAVMSNLYSMGTYFIAGSEVSSLASQAGSIPIVGPPLESYKLVLLLLIVPCIILSLVKWGPGESWKRGIIWAGTLQAAGFNLLYFTLPSPVSIELISFPSPLEPFVDTDKFVLVAWMMSYMCVATACSCPRLINGANERPAAPGPSLTPFRSRIGLTSILSRVPRPRDFASRQRLPSGVQRFTYIQVAALSSAALLLLLGLFSTIQPGAPNVNGFAFLDGENSFPSSQIPQSYFQLRHILLENHATFGLGFHTLVVPMNPGSYIPSSIGANVIPGFIPPSTMLGDLTRLIIRGDMNDCTDFMSAVGIKYVAVDLTETPAPWWPSLAQGPPSVESLWPGGWLPLGNASEYLSLLSNWTSLVKVYDSSSLVIFRNLHYIGPMLTFPSVGVLNDLASGSYLNLTNLDPMGTPEIHTSSLYSAGGWAMSPPNQGVLLPNGTFELPYESSSAYAYFLMSLPRSAVYLLSLNVSTRSLVDSFGPSRPPTYVAAYWDSFNSTFVSPNGGVVFPPIPDDVSEHLEYIIRTPVGIGNLSAALYLYAGPSPVNGSLAFVRFFDVQLQRINGSDEFSSLVHAVGVTATGPTSFTAMAQVVSKHPSILVVDTYGADSWRAALPSSLEERPVFNQLGLLAFALPANMSSITLFYTGQSTYQVTLLVSLTTEVAAAAFLLVSVVFIRPSKKWPHTAS